MKNRRSSNRSSGSLFQNHTHSKPLSFEDLEARHMLAATNISEAFSPDDGGHTITAEHSAPAVNDTEDTSVRVIVHLTDRDVVDNVLAELDADATDVQRMKRLPMVVVSVPESSIHALEESEYVISVSRDVAQKALLAEATPLTQAFQANNSLGYDGTGTTIAILDTGVEDTNSFFSDRIIAERCFSQPTAGTKVSLCPNGETRDDDASIRDAVGCSFSLCEHGTHVTGIAAGSREFAPSAPGDGVASNANIISIQVFTRVNDSGQCGGDPFCVLAFESDYIAALDEVLELSIAHPEWGIVSANMSLGDGMHTTACDTSPVKVAVDMLLSNDIATVIAAGNESFFGAVGSPGCVSTAFTVGSVTDALQPSSFTNRSGALLDVFAPGSDIISSAFGGYASQSGTSMAAPHVAGALAQLRQASPGRPVTDLMDDLVNTGSPVLYLDSLFPPNLVSTPLIQVVNAIPDDYGNDLGSSARIGSSLVGPTTSPHLTAAEIAPYGDNDLFHFYAHQGVDVSISVLGAAAGYPSGINVGTFALLDSTGATIASQSIPFGHLLPIQFTIPNLGQGTMGPYYVEVNGDFLLFSEIGRYGLGLAHETDHGFVVENAEAITAGDAVAGLIEVGGSQDLFTLTATAGQRILLETTLGDLGDSLLTLYAADGVTELAFDNDGGNGLGSLIDYTTASGGQFFVKVSGNGFLDQTGTYELALALGSDSDNDDQLSEATSASTGQTFIGSIDNLNDVDMFAITVNANEQVFFDLDTPTLGLDSILRVFDAFGNQLSMNDDGVGPAPEYSTLESYVDLTFATAGTYYIGVSSFGNTAYDAVTGSGDAGGTTMGDFELSFIGTVIGDPDDQIVEAPIQNVGDAITDNIDAGDDVDLFGFTVTANQLVGFDIDTPTSNLDSILRLFDAAGNQILLSDDDVGPVPEYGNRESFFEYTFPAAGTYYVGVSSFGNAAYNPLTGENDGSGQSDGSYELTLIGAPDVPNGDFSGDGVLDGVDIDLLITNIAVGPPDETVFDMTGDGNVDLADRDEWLAVAGAANIPSGNPYLLGDANLDQVVDVSDFNIWNTSKFTNQSAWSKGDFNADGVVDVSDFNLWNINKFSSSNDVVATPLRVKPTIGSVTSSAIPIAVMDHLLRLKQYMPTPNEIVTRDAAFATHQTDRSRPLVPFETGLEEDEVSREVGIAEFEVIDDWNYWTR